MDYNSILSITSHLFNSSAPNESICLQPEYIKIQPTFQLVKVYVRQKQHYATTNPTFIFPQFMILLD